MHRASYAPRLFLAKNRQMGNERQGSSGVAAFDLLTEIPDLHKVYIDDETYTHGHGKAYQFYGVDANAGAIVIVRPDQCLSLEHI